MIRTLCLAFAASAVFAWSAWVSVAQAENWPQFRGPSGEGHSSVKDLPLAWGEDSDNIKWKAPIDGLGWSSPMVASGSRRRRTVERCCARYVWTLKRGT